MRAGILSGILFLLACNHPESEELTENQNYKLSFEDERISSPVISEVKEYYEVIGVKDGDTIVLLIDGAAKTVRLSHIDCPEKKQPFGNRAKQFVSDMCFGKNVAIESDGKADRDGRLIAEILLEEGINLNKEIVKAGLAWHYKKFSTDSEYADLEIAAQKAQLGLWIDENPIAPWEWRKISKKK